MQYIYLQQAGKPVEGSSGVFWTLAGVALPQDKWKALELRVNGLQKSFLKGNYTPLKSHMDANALLHPRNAEKRWTKALSKGLEKIVAGLDAKFFLVVVDKRTTDRPAHGRWLLPLSYHYLAKPIGQYLKETGDQGCLVIPPGRPDETQVIADLQVENLFGSSGRQSNIICSPMVQDISRCSGLQVADFVATIARRYHEIIYPKLFAKQTLVGYDAVVNSHYQGFVKPHTFQSEATDEKGYKIRGYIYLWRRDHQIGGMSRASDEFPRPSADAIRVSEVSAGQ